METDGTEAAEDTETGELGATEALWKVIVLLLTTIIEVMVVVIELVVVGLDTSES